MKLIEKNNEAITIQFSHREADCVAQIIRMAENYWNDKDTDIIDVEEIEITELTKKLHILIYPVRL